MPNATGKHQSNGAGIIRTDTETISANIVRKSENINLIKNGGVDRTECAVIDATRQQSKQGEKGFIALSLPILRRYTMEIDGWVGPYKVKAFPWIDGKRIYFNVQYYEPRWYCYCHR